MNRRKKRTCKSDIEPTPNPLLPERNRYVYKPDHTAAAAAAIAKTARHRGVDVVCPKALNATGQLVSVLCHVEHAGVWDKACEKALQDLLPLREHNVAFLSHTLFVTMIGALVARVLEQGTCNAKDPVDLLTDRLYIRNIACHDCTKTSRTESVAYSGIMAAHTAGHSRPQKKHSTNVRELTRLMADFGLKHHYANNPHHPEHFPTRIMPDVNVIEAVVDGLACAFQMCHEHYNNPIQWLDMFTFDRFSGNNVVFAKHIVKCLKHFVTLVDYKALVTFRRAVFLLMGQPTPWSSSLMPDCCGSRAQPEDSESR